VGRGSDGRPHQRHPAATHLLPAVSPLPALLPAAARPLQGQVSLGPGERRQAGLEAHQGTPHQL